MKPDAQDESPISCPPLVLAASPRAPEPLSPCPGPPTSNMCGTCVVPPRMSWRWCSNQGQEELWSHGELAEESLTCPLMASKRSLHFNPVFPTSRLIAGGDLPWPLAVPHAADQSYCLFPKTLLFSESPWRMASSPSLSQSLNQTRSPPPAWMHPQGWSSRLSLPCSRELPLPPAASALVLPGPRDDGRIQAPRWATHILPGVVSAASPRHTPSGAHTPSRSHTHTRTRSTSFRPTTPCSAGKLLPPPGLHPRGPLAPSPSCQPRLRGSVLRGPPVSPGALGHFL